MTDNKAHAVNTLIGIIYLFIITYFYVNYIQNSIIHIDLWIIGTFWLVLTVAFEFGFGHYIAKHSWTTLLEDYNLLKGRTWSLFLIMTFLAPIINGFILGI